MPVQNVADLIGQRDLTAEAQGWAEIRLKNKELQMKQDKHAEATKPKPYKFDWVDWSSQNPMGEQWMQDLGKQSTLMTQADSKYLSIPYYDTERCGPECQDAWARYYNNKNTARTMQNFQTQLQKDYSDLLTKYNDSSGEWRNAETKAKLERMQDWWKQGMQWKLNDQGLLDTIVEETVEVPMETEDGQPIYLTANGEQTTNKEDAATGGDGKPQLAMDEKTVQKQISLQDFYQGLDLDPIQNIAFSPSDLSTELSENRLSFVNNEGQVVDLETMDADQKADYDTAISTVEAYVFGSTGYWNNETGMGDVTAKGRGIVGAMRRTPPWSDGTPITKDDILKFALNQSYGHVWEKPDVDDDTGYWTPEKIEETFMRETTLSGTQNVDGALQDSNYAFHGNTFFTDINGSSKASMPFDPQRMTLLRGDDAFATGDVSGTGQNMSFKFNEIGISRFNPDTGRFISEEVYNAMSDEEKGKVIWRAAIFATVSTKDKNIGKDWQANKLISGSSTEATYTVDAIMPIDGMGAALSAIGPEGQRTNADTVKIMEQKAAQLNEQTGTGNEGSGDVIDNDDPLGILD